MIFTNKYLRKYHIYLHHFHGFKAFEQKLLASKNTQGLHKRRCCRITICARVVYIASVHTNNYSFCHVTSFAPHWASCLRCPSGAVILSESDSQRLPQWGGFLCAPHPPPHHSHTIGDPFQRLLAGSLATFSSQPSLPWGCKWWKEENKDARWMLGSEVRLVAHSGPSSQPRRGWMSFFGKALREEKKLIPQPGATMMPGFSAILQRGLACDLDQGKTHYKGHSTLGLLGTNHIHLNTLNGQKHLATPINLWINVFSVPWLQWIKMKHLAPLQAFMKEWDIVH